MSERRKASLQASQDSMPFWLGLAVVLAATAGVMTVIQYASPSIVGYDGYYHIKYAYLLRTLGLNFSFDWLPLTILNVDAYVDHHFLFHLLLIPFTFGDLVTGAKLASIVFSVLMFLCVWWLLREQGVPYAWVWVLALLVVSEAFLYRMSMPRAQSLSLAALALGIHFLLREQNRALFVLGWLYAWLFDGFPLLLAVALAHCVSVWLSEKRLTWRPFASAGAGITAGLVVNPYFPKNMTFIYQHIVPKIGLSDSVRVGSEWYPYSTAQLLENSGLVFALLAVAILCIGLAGKRMETKVTMGLLLVFLFGAMLWQSRRFIEYFPAIVVIFSAFSFRSLAASLRLPASRKPVAALFAAVLLAAAGWSTVNAARASAATSQDAHRYLAAADWLRQNTSRGERIFHTDWDDFPELFFHNHHNTYLVGLDPTYFQLHDGELFNLWVAVTRGEVSQPAGVISNAFHTQYVFSDLNHDAFIDQAANDPNLQEVFRDQEAIIFRISPPID